MRLTLINILLFFSLNKVSAQDIHFTQYINSHLTLNPALTGFFQGNIRANANYRSQWASVSTPFVTSSFSFDSKILQKKMNENGLGVGVVLLTDKSGSAKLINFMALISTSYIKSIGSSGYQYLSFGLQGGFFQKWFNFNSLRFGNQFDGLDFNSSLQSGETAQESKIWNGDINAGLVFSRSEPFKTKYSAGISFFHLNQPVESFLDSKNTRSLRTVFHGNVLFFFSEELWLGPDMYFAHQKKSREINFGGSMIYKLEPIRNTDTYLNFSTGYRWSDAINILTGLKYGKWLISFSYDINISEMVPASNYRGGYEISLIYSDLFVPGKKKLPFIVPCSSF